MSRWHLVALLVAVQAQSAFCNQNNPIAIYNCDAALSVSQTLSGEIVIDRNVVFEKAGQTKRHWFFSDGRIMLEQYQNLGESQSKYIYTLLEPKAGHQGEYLKYELEYKNQHFFSIIEDGQGGYLISTRLERESYMNGVSTPIIANLKIQGEKLVLETIAESGDMGRLQNVNGEVFYSTLSGKVGLLVDNKNGLNPYDVIEFTDFQPAVREDGVEVLSLSRNGHSYYLIGDIIEDKYFIVSKTPDGWGKVALVKESKEFEELRKLFFRPFVTKRNRLDVVAQNGAAVSFKSNPRMNEQFFEAFKMVDGTLIVNASVRTNDYMLGHRQVGLFRLNEGGAISSKPISLPSPAVAQIMRLESGTFLASLRAHPDTQTRGGGLYAFNLKDNGELLPGSWQPVWAPTTDYVEAHPLGVQELSDGSILYLVEVADQHKNAKVQVIKMYPGQQRLAR